MRRLLIALVIAGAAVGCSTSYDQPVTVDTQGGGSAISQGAGSKDASADVKLKSFKEVDEGYGLVHHVGTIVVTNHSEKPSDYYIELSVENQAGENIGWTNATVEHLQPGKVARTTVDVYEEGAHKLLIHEVQRTASL